MMSTPLSTPRSRLAVESADGSPYGRGPPHDGTTDASNAHVSGWGQNGDRWLRPQSVAFTLRKSAEGDAPDAQLPGSEHSLVPIRTEEEVRAIPDGATVLLGYAGWDSGQLEEEMGMGAWFVTNARFDDLLKAPLHERFALAGRAVDEE